MPTVASGILYLRMHREFRDVFLCFLVLSVRDFANCELFKERLEKLKKIKYGRKYCPHALLEREERKISRVLGRTSSFYSSLYFCLHSSVSGLFGMRNMMAGLAILVGMFLGDMSGYSWSSI